MNLCDEDESNEKSAATRISFTQAVREKYCMSDGVGFDSFSVILSPKKRNVSAELGHLRTIVLNQMNVMTAGIPSEGLMWLCPNVVDLDLTNNLLDKWSELFTILCHMPHLKFVNASKNNIYVDTNVSDLPKTCLNIENLALNYTGISIEDIVQISQMMPALKELHLCGNGYEQLGVIDVNIKNGSLACLECLRLNSNKIQSWSEVWKLCHLQCLKSLILSDNPVTNLFYNEMGETYKNNLKTSSLDKSVPFNICLDNYQRKNSELDTLDHRHFNDHNVPQANGDCINQRIENVKFGSRNPYELADSTNYQQENNKFCLSDEDLIRPVSRIARHDDSDDENDEWIDLQNIILEDLPQPENEYDDYSVNSFQVDIKDKNESFSTDSSIFTVTDDDSFMEAPSFSDYSDTEVSQQRYIDISESNYASIAESFLQDVINNIDFISSQGKSSSTVPRCSAQVLPSNMSLNIDDSQPSQSNENSIIESDESLQFEMDSLSRSAEKHELVLQDCNFSFIKDLSKASSINFSSTPVSSTMAQRDSKEAVHQCHNNVNFRDNEHMPASNYKCNLKKHVPQCGSLGSHNEEQLVPSNRKSKSEKSNSDLLNNDSEDSRKDETRSDDLKDVQKSSHTSSISPFQNLDMLCLSSAGLSHWMDLDVLSCFPKLTNIRVQGNPLYSTINPDDRRKLYIASLPYVTILNGSEVTETEREKAERHYLRHFMHKEEKPDIYQKLIKKHGEPVALVEIDLSAGYREWACLDFIFDGERKFSKKLHLKEPIKTLRTLISQKLLLPKQSFIMHFKPCNAIHPEYERDMTELRCELLPMSRFNFADGDEIHISTCY